MQKTLIFGVLLGLTIASFVLFTLPQAIGAVLFAVGVVGVRMWLNLRALKRLRAARLAFDASAMHRELDRMLGRYGIDPRTRAAVRFEKAIAFLIEEKYAEALEIFRAQEQEPLSERNQHARVSNIAWCKLHLGDIPGAIADAEAGLRSAEEHGDSAIAAHLGTLGAAYVMGDRAADALPLLDRALGLDVPVPALRAIHHYYRGEALKALGRDSAAKQAWEAAAQSGPGRSPWVSRAQRRLASLSV